MAISRTPRSTASIALWLPVVLCLAAIFAFASLPTPVALGLRSEDKLRHLVAFAALAGLTLRAVSGSWRLRQGHATAWAFALTLVSALAVEVVQRYVPGRSCEAADIVAGMVGAVLSVALIRRWPHRPRPA